MKHGYYTRTDYSVVEALRVLEERSLASSSSWVDVLRVPVRTLVERSLASSSWIDVLRVPLRALVERSLASSSGVDALRALVERSLASSSGVDVLRTLAERSPSDSFTVGVLCVRRRSPRPALTDLCSLDSFLEDVLPLPLRVLSIRCSFGSSALNMLRVLPETVLP